ncbi:FAD binding domain-containing protein [Whalleya microplaca]|nr:FAD binding domain-containing protein [Whalleya microplaca]
MQNTVDVLIIGGGPTGLTLALELAAHQTRFRIVDKATARSPYSRALVVQPRSLELLNRHGDVRALRACGTTADGTSVCVNGREVAYVETERFKLSGTAFPSPAAVSQWHTERWLEAALERRGPKVEMGKEAQSIVQDGEGVTIRLVGSDGEEEVVRAKYVVGADGAHSCVRHASNLTFEGDAYPQEFILADTHIKSQMPNNRAFMCLGKGVMVVLPLNADGMVRLVVSRPDQNQTGQPKLEDFQEFLQEVFPGGGELHDPVWLTRFHLHHRGVNNYRDGRLLVAGDAAHIHSPAGGQGMNTGIQDAANLGWKLASVLRGERPDSFLDSYNTERHPVGQYLLRSSDRTFSYITTTNPIALFLRNLILPWILPLFMSSVKLTSRYFETISELRIRYRRSDIVGTASGFVGPIRGGDRAIDGRIRGPEGEKWLYELFAPETHHLVLFSGLGSNAASEGDLHRAEVKFLEESGINAKVHTVFAEAPNGQSGFLDLEGELHKTYGFDNAGYLLVRPDTYIAHIGPLSALNGVISWVRQ